MSLAHRRRPLDRRFASAVVLLAMSAWFGPAHAAETLRLRGTIANVAGSTVSIRLEDGSTTDVTLGRNAKVTTAVRASLADVAPGMFVGIANVGPNGLQDALEVHIFPDAMRGTGGGQQRWDLGSHSRMTEGTAGSRVESYDGQDLTLTYKGGESTIQVRPNTPVVRFAPGALTDLTPGASAFIRNATRQTDGALTADAILVGKNGTKLSM